jgi:16S rRNA (cytosine967-C5)-methyltransferase
LSAAIDAVRVGGAVVYATCSPHLAETVAVVETTLREHPDVAAIDARPLFGEVPELGDGPSVQLWPQRHGTDAMFVAVLVKRR